MTENQSGTRHRRHRSRAEADHLAAQYEASGLTREEFCRQRDVPLKTLCRYVARYRKRKAESEQPPRFIEAEVARHIGGGGGLAVLLTSGRRIVVERGFDVGTLRQLVAVLEQV